MFYSPQTLYSRDCLISVMRKQPFRAVFIILVLLGGALILTTILGTDISAWASRIVGTNGNDFLVGLSEPNDIRGLGAMTKFMEGQ